jgi:hypothetical protein
VPSRRGLSAENIAKLGVAQEKNRLFVTIGNFQEIAPHSRACIRGGAKHALTRFATPQAIGPIPDSGVREWFFHSQHERTPG